MSKLNFLQKAQAQALSALIAASIAALAPCTMMAATGFFDDFSGPTLNPRWQASLPTMNIAEPEAGSTQSTTYIGAPNYAFQTLGSDSVLRLSNSMLDHQRVGWSTTDTFSGAFRYEVRFNTLNQSGNSIDAFLEIGILDAANNSRYDITSPYGGNFSNSRRFTAGSSIDNSYNHTFFNYQDNTWYRMVLEGDPGQNLRASLLSDTGTELAAFNLAHTAAAFGSGYRLFLSQALGEPGGQAAVDVAVDYAQLTLIPEPSSAALIVLGCGLILVRRRRPA